MFVVMPLPRTRPQWYMPILTDICKIVIANVKSFLTPIRVMPATTLSFSDLDSDGVHLNAIIGLPYVQGLIDNAR